MPMRPGHAVPFLSPRIWLVLVLLASALGASVIAPAPAVSAEVFTATTTPELTEVTAGDAHTCGLDDDMDAWCWGDDSSGQLGNGGTNRDASVPTLVAGGLKFSQLTAG
jgi:hypothetical protein